MLKKKNRTLKLYLKVVRRYFVEKKHDENIINLKKVILKIK